MSQAFVKTIEVYPGKKYTYRPVRLSTAYEVQTLHEEPRCRALVFDGEDPKDFDDPKEAFLVAYTYNEGVPDDVTRARWDYQEGCWDFLEYESCGGGFSDREDFHADG